jgi:hypothetical protein
MEREQEVLAAVEQFADVVVVLDDNENHITYALKAFTEPKNKQLVCDSCHGYIPLNCMFVDSWSVYVLQPQLDSNYRICRRCVIRNNLLDKISFWKATSFLIQNPCDIDAKCAAFHLTGDINVQDENYGWYHKSNRGKDYSDWYDYQFDEDSQLQDLLDLQDQVNPDSEFTPGTRPSRIKYKLEKNRKKHQ